MGNEKKCKHCAMMIPDEAKICPHCRKRQGMPVIGGILVVFIFFVLIALMVPAFTGVKSSKWTGEKGVLVSGAEFTPVAMSEQILDEWVSARVNKDGHGQVSLLASDKVVGVKSGTKVLIIDRATFSRKVRVIEGENEGLAGWVPTEYVR
jgi:hypothetical protein